MKNNELLKRIENCHEWQSQAILELRELIKNENNFTQEAITEIRNNVLQKIQLNITEMEILAMELGV